MALDTKKTMYFPSHRRMSPSFIRIVKCTCSYQAKTPTLHQPRIQRHFKSTIHHAQRLSSTTSHPDFIPIYKFPYIVQANIICRLKLYQTGITVLMVPAATIGYMAGLTTAVQCQNVGLICGLACIMLYIMGGFFQRLVGIMYLKNTGDTLKISHLTFMGKRRDVIALVEDVVPLADMGDHVNPKKIYHHLKFYSNKQTFYFIIRFGGILQPKLFAHVFGEEVLKLHSIPSKNENKEDEKN